MAYENIPDEIKSKDRWFLYKADNLYKTGYLYRPSDKRRVNVSSMERSGISDFQNHASSFADVSAITSKPNTYELGYWLDVNEYALNITEAISTEDNNVIKWVSNLVGFMGSYAEMNTSDGSVLILFTLKDNNTRIDISKGLGIGLISHKQHSMSVIPLTGHAIAQVGKLKDCTDIIDTVYKEYIPSSLGIDENGKIIVKDEIISPTNESNRPLNLDDLIKAVQLRDETRTSTHKESEMPETDETYLLLSQDRQITDLPLDNLVEYEKHPFKPYEGDKLDTMVKSVQAMRGVIHPIIVRKHPRQDGKFEIISGHNRVRACKQAGLTTIKGIIENLNDDAAALVLIDTNIEQRKDLAISEIAFAFKLAHDVNKRQGERSDLKDDSELLDNVVQKFKKWTSEIMGSYSDKSDRTIRRLIRLTELSQDFRDDLDAGKLSPNAGEALSYLSEDEQVDLRNLLSEKNHKITVRQAKTLKKATESEEELSKERMLEIIDLDKPIEPVKRSTVKLPYASISQFFDEDLTDEDITNRIIEALTKYRGEQ